MASHYGKVEVVEALLAAGADREAKTNVRAPLGPPYPPYDPPIGSDPIGHGLRYGGGVEKGPFLEVGVPGGLGGRAMARWVALRDSRQGPSRHVGGGGGQGKKGGRKRVFFYFSPCRTTF